MKWPDGKRYYSLNQYYRECFGEKTYKLALDIGATCPNRDGTLGSRGCIYCSKAGSGDNATPALQGLAHQIDTAISLLRGKYDGDSFIAYLQSFTNTYGPTDTLMALYKEILAHPKIKGLSIGTRPDCLDDRLLDGLADLQATAPVWVELGLQTIHEDSANFINRCYPLSVFDDAVARLHARNIPVVVHLIAGLPGEEDAAFLESVRYVSRQGIAGIKFHMLHVLKDTELGTLYNETPFSMPDMVGYCRLICDAIQWLPPEIVVHRLNGDPPAELLLAPSWTTDKRTTLNTIQKILKAEDGWQGKYLKDKSLSGGHP